MTVRGVVDRIEEDTAVILLGDEGHIARWPLALLPDVQPNDLFCFDFQLELPASEVKRISPKSLLERLATQR
jgi:hypothetical protein